MMAKARYKKAKTKLPLRDDAMLSRVPLERADGSTFIPWNVVAPGLYPDEEVIKLDSGEMVAVSIEPEWLENNGGIALHAFGRWLNEDGSTHEAFGFPVETSYSATFNHTDVDEHGVDNLAKAVTALILGEDQPNVKVHVDKDVVSGKAPQFPNGAVGVTSMDAARSSRPLIDIPPEAAKSASIRSAIEKVHKLQGLRVKV
jgi:hypothetical protein